MVFFPKTLQGKFILSFYLLQGTKTVMILETEGNFPEEENNHVGVKYLTEIL